MVPFLHLKFHRVVQEVKPKRLIEGIYNKYGPSLETLKFVFSGKFLGSWVI